VTVGLDLEGLARVGGRLFAIDVWGRVLELDENDNIVGEHDDLSTLFPDYENSLRVRGATRVIVPAP
jgi:hypothetical protein